MWNKEIWKMEHPNEKLSDFDWTEILREDIKKGQEELQASARKSGLRAPKDI